MSKGKIFFCLFLFLLSFIYAKDKLNNIDLFNMLIKDNKTSNIITNTIKSKLNFNDKSYQKEITNIKPIVYLYNTHQTEEYASNIYNITPNVTTVSDMLKEELESYNIKSLVETKSVIKELKKSGEDYSYTYTITLNYLKQRKKEYPSLKYYFDIHRDSVTGEASKIIINGKKYARAMFLLGQNNPNYKKNENNIKIMMKYLNKNYPNLMRSIYYQPLYAYNQNNDEQMFLIEVGGPDNTLEELYNTSKALSKAISYYIKEIEYEK